MPVSAANSQIVYDGLKSCGVRIMSALPETWLVHLIRLADEDPEVTLVRLAKEEEGVGISMGAHFAGVKSGVVERLALHCNRVPADVELGVHLCYGSYGGRHWKEPESAANMVQVHNRLARELHRPIDYIHMPVPADRGDDAYFRPLARLKLAPETKLFLGLVHDSDGVEGTRKRIAVAAKYARDFGVATECGFGRRPPETIPNLLRVHAEL